ncbi:RagB/SusD family nutrient uptake outer membrane protein [Leeuwenhoekiella parthenopeia]|uniref:RagB/SusD family nutrient uptake outer membrane protein n=1 Tax=Leeuwenhoekiella parthenopeia TaxID=2890320 RepID=A0ABS8GPU1_9FLAO|nr:RagB/SusD family nutrient uptake outer membrane protein [Leeuwenhoekiella parthenopeia]MCC4211997.1 RagB/SusD family nutrient uptake outer membrane protein [Leeuwenhoekiella parthenopeia]
MKIFIKNLAFLILILTIYSCEDTLEPTPYSFTSPENFYQSAQDAEIALVGVYNTLTAGSIQGEGNADSFRRDLYEMLVGGTGEGVVPLRFANNRGGQFGTAAFTSQDNEINFTWFFLYAGISRANSLIENLPNIPDDDFIGTRKVEIEAEAKLLRGFFHTILSMMHGAIPIYTRTDEDPTKGRQPVQEVYTQILEDYEFAYQNLQDRGPLAASVNKWTAAGLLVKVHTYLASMKTNGLSDFGYSPNSFEWVDANTSYGNAVTISNDIVANSGYILTPNYDRLFRESTKSAQAEEVLFAAEASSDASQQVINIVVNNFIPQGNPQTVGGGSGWTRPTGELYDLYSSNDFRFSHNVSGNLGGNPNILDVVEIDGIRYYQPRILPGKNNGFMSIGKYRMKDPDQKTYAPWASGISFPLLRYADILLLRAEALFYTGDEPGARAILSELRQRSVVEPALVDDLDTAYFNPDFIKELQEERSRELCFEIWRRFDLARFNIFDETINSLDTDNGFYNDDVVLLQQNWISEKVWFPIPLQQIDLNPNLVQNPGY